MKNLLSLVLVIVTIAAVCFGVYKYILPQDKKTEYRQDFGTSAESITISASLLNLEVKEGDSFAVEYEGSENLCPECTYDENSKTLSIIQPEYKPKKRQISDENELVVYIPTDAEINVFKLNNSVGDTNLGNLKAKEVNLFIDLGSIKSEKIETGKLRIEANLGDVKIDECSCKDIDIVANLGNVEIGVDGNIKNYSIGASASLGDIEIGSDKYNNNYVQTGSEGSIKINCSLGNVKIK